MCIEMLIAGRDQVLPALLVDDAVPSLRHRCKSVFKENAHLRQNNVFLQSLRYRTSQALALQPLA